MILSPLTLEAWLLPEVPPPPAWMLEPAGAPEEFLLAAPLPAEAPPAEEEAGAAPPPPAEPGPPPGPVPEDAFPAIGELDALLAGQAGPAPVPDAATRAEVAAALGLDPAMAADPALFLAALEGFAPPEADPLPAEAVSEPDMPAWWWTEPRGDWLLE